MIPEISLDEFKTRIAKVLEDYFQKKELHETVEAIDALQCKLFHDELIVMAVRLSLDFSNEQRVLVTDLIEILYERQMISSHELMRGFEKLILMIDDLALDVPGAPSMILDLVELHIANNMIPQEMLYRLPESLLKLLIAQADKNNKELPMLRSQLKSLQTFKDRIRACVDEFFVAVSFDEVETEMKENSLPEYHHEVVRKAVLMSLDHGDREKELVSRLLCKLSVDQALAYEDMVIGFTRLVSSIEDDLQLDYPAAGDFIGKFIVRAITDECLPPSFISNCLRLRIGKATGKKVLKHVEAVLNKPGALEYSARIWGDPANDLHLLPEHVAETALKQEIKDTIVEYFHAKEKAEVSRILRELCMLTYQKAEFIRKLVIFAMERNDEQMADALDLMVYLCESSDEIDYEDIVSGFDQLYENMDDIKLDIPDAPQLIEKFVSRSIQRGLLPETYNA